MGHLTNYSKPEDLIRLKKSLQFIEEVVKSYEAGLFQHVGLSSAIAISKAEDLRGQISQYCRAYPLLSDLIEVLNNMALHGQANKRAAELLQKISDYFQLERYSLNPRPNDLLTDSF